MGVLHKIFMTTPSQGHLFNFKSAKCKNRMNCHEGLRLDSFNEKAPIAPKPHCSHGSLAFSLCQKKKGKRKILQARCCFHLCSALSPLFPLVLHLVSASSSFLLSFLSPPTSLASSLCHLPPLHHFYVSFLFFSGTGSPPMF